MIRIETPDAPAFEHAFAQAPQILREELMTAMREADLLLQREVMDRTPTAHGTLRASVFGEERIQGDGVLGVVGSPLAHAAYVELGTRPHFPPLEPLEDWAKTKLGVSDERAPGVALAIARKIAARGTLAVGMFHRAFAATQGQYAAMFERATARAMQRVATLTGKP